VALTVLGSISIWQWNSAVREARTATAGQLGARAENLRMDNANRIEESVLLAVESLRIDETLAGRQSLINSLRWLLPPVVRLNRKKLITTMRFGADARTLFIASDDTIERWDVTTGQKIGSLQDPAPVKVLETVFQGGELLASGTADGQFSLRRLPDEKPRFSVSLGSGIVDIQFGREGSPILVRTKGSRPLYAVDPLTGLVQYKSPFDQAIAATYDSEGSHLIRLLRQTVVPKGIRAVVASPSENYVGNHRFSSLAQLRNSRNGMLAAVMPVLGQTGSLVFSGDGTLVGAEDWDNRVFIFRADAHPGYYRVAMEAVVGRGLGRNVRQLEFAGKDRVLATTTRFGAIECTAGAPRPRPIYPSTADRRPYRISADEHYALTVGRGNNAVQLWESAPKPREIWRDEVGRELLDAQFSRDGRWVVLLSERQAEVRETGSGRVHLPLEGRTKAAAFDSTSGYLAVAAKETCVWEVVAKRKVYCVPVSGSAVALTASGQALAVAMPEYVLIRQQDRSSVRLPHAGVHILVFSSKGEHLAAVGGSSDTASGSPRIWNSRTGMEEVTIPHVEDGVYSSVYSLAFSPDDETLVTAGRDILFHHWRNQGLIQDACARLTRNLTQDEWTQFFPRVPYRKTCPSLPEKALDRVVRTEERVPLFGSPY
jgi:WD40 repeat protein